MPAVAPRRTTKDTADARTVRVVSLTHAFQDMHRYRRGDELDLVLTEGQAMPAWCIAAADAPRTSDGRIDLNELPLFFPASTRF